MRKVFCLIAFFSVPLVEASAERAGSGALDDWPQWRGPLASGVAPQGDPPVEWSEAKNIKWKVPVPGRGSATPIVWEDRIYLLTAVSTKANQGERGGGSGRGGFGAVPAPDAPYQFRVICLDLGTGRTLWERVAIEELPHEGGHSTNTFASGSPVTDGKYLYASFGSRGIYCYDLEGNLQWKRDLGDMHTRNAFGEGSSPALHGDTLIINWDHEGESFIAALDATNGKTRWQVPRDERSTWATPLVVEGANRTQVVTNGSNRVRSYDLKTGELLWQCGGQATNPIPSPITEDDLVYCMTGYQGYAVYAIPLDASGDISDTKAVAWQRTDTGPYVTSPLLYDGLLYVTKGRDALLTCMDPKTGKTVYGPKRLPDLSTLYASPVAADGRVYFTDRNGTTLVLRHGAELDVLATNQLDEGIDASPVIVGRQLLLRSENHLYCIEERQTEEGR